MVLVIVKEVSQPHNLYIGRCTKKYPVLHQENVVLNNDGQSQISAKIRVGIWFDNIFQFNLPLILVYSYKKKNEASLRLNTVIILPLLSFPFNKDPKNSSSLTYFLSKIPLYPIVNNYIFSLKDLGSNSPICKFNTIIINQLESPHLNIALL